MTAIIIIVVLFYSFFWVFSLFLVTKAQKALHCKFPNEANKYLGTRKSLLINNKLGLLFLWDDEIIRLSKRDKSIEGLRRKASFCVLFSLASILIMPLTILIIWWFFFRV